MGRCTRRSCYTISTGRTRAKKEGRPFDRTIVSQLLGNFEKSPNSRITQEEFVRIWMDMESNLRAKIDKNENEIKKANLCIIENVV